MKTFKWAFTAPEMGLIIHVPILYVTRNLIRRTTGGLIDGLEMCSDGEILIGDNYE